MVIAPGCAVTRPTPAPTNPDPLAIEMFGGPRVSVPLARAGRIDRAASSSRTGIEPAREARLMMDLRMKSVEPAARARGDALASPARLRSWMYGPGSARRRRACHRLAVEPPAACPARGEGGACAPGASDRRARART